MNTHQSYLESRGISTLDAQRLGIRWIDHETAVKSYKFGKLATSPEGIIWFPISGDRGCARNYYSSDAARAHHLESINKWRQLKGLSPEKHTAKYLLPEGCNNRTLYDPWSTLYPDSETPVLFATEDTVGVTKASFRGLRIVSAPGVWLSSNTEIGESREITFHHDLSGKFPVFLADSDGIENPHVAQALARTGLTLHIPIGVFPASRTAKIGLDEWLDANPTATAEDLAAMVAANTRDPMEWIGEFILNGVSWLSDRGHPESLALKVYSTVRDAVLHELLKHYSVEDLRGNGFYQKYLKPAGLTLGGIKQREPRHGGGEDSCFDLLMAIAEPCQFWHTDDGIAYADIMVDGIRQTHPVRSRVFRTWLCGRLWQEHDRGANSEAMQSCLNALEAKAFHGGVERSIFLRTGKDADGNVYLDLSNDKWEVVKVSRDGWQIIPSAECPIRFIRNAAQLPLPHPTRGRSIDQLWEFIKINDASKPLLLGWILSCLVPDGDKPIIILTGSKGGGKTTIGEVLKALLDPGKAGLLPKIGDARNLAAAARNRWILGFDNLSSLSIEDQDNLCRTSTGAGFSHRLLHSDLDEAFIEYCRPQLLTSVDFIPTKSDLLDRSIIIQVNRMAESDRIPKTELTDKLNAAIPSLLGAALDLLVVALRNLDSVTQPLPRMTDYARLAIAAGIDGFIENYRANIDQAEDAAIEASPVASAIVDLAEKDNYWRGSATDLLTILKNAQPDELQIKKLTARSLGKKLAGHLKSDLEAVGVSLDNYRDGRSRLWIISRQQPDKPDLQTSQTSQNTTQPLESLQGNGSGHGRTPDVWHDVCDVSELNVIETSSLKPSQGRHYDVSDVCDVSISRLSSNGNGEVPSGDNRLTPDELEELPIEQLESLLQQRG